MKVYGNVTLSEGSDVKNLTVPHGDAYPQNPNVGELFYHNVLGLSFHNGQVWKVVGVKSDEYIFNDAFAIEFVDGKANKIIPSVPFKTTALYVGGQRQKLNADYFEMGDYLSLNYELTSADIDSGINIVLDLVKQAN